MLTEKEWLPPVITGISALVVAWLAKRDKVADKARIEDVSVAVKRMDGDQAFRQMLLERVEYLENRIDEKEREKDALDLLLYEARVKGDILDRENKLLRDRIQTLSAGDGR